MVTSTASLNRVAPRRERREEPFASPAAAAFVAVAGDDREIKRLHNLQRGRMITVQGGGGSHIPRVAYNH